MDLCRSSLVTLLVVTFSAALAEPPKVQVISVHPSGPTVPANLLRISIELAAPIEGPLLPRLSLVPIDGGTVEEPFLRQELWSPSGKVLTVLLHPGRVKSGLNAHDEKGPILSTGEDVAVALDGKPIKRWSVSEADRHGAVPAAWRFSEVRAGSRQVLVVSLDEPVDALGVNYLAVRDARGRRVEGRAQLLNGEMTWAFTPRRPWRPGDYELVVRGTMEDPAGNRMDRQFESSGGSNIGRSQDAVLAFSVTSARPPLATRRPIDNR